MSLTDPSSSWIWSIRVGDAIASNSQSADLQQHNNFGTFNIDLTKATGGNSVNPFAQSSTSTQASGTAAAPLATTTSSSSGEEKEGPSPTKHMRVIAHGVLMSLAFLSVLSSSKKVTVLTLPGFSSRSVHLPFVCFHSRAWYGYTPELN